MNDTITDPGRLLPAPAAGEDLDPPGTGFPGKPSQPPPGAVEPEVANGAETHVPTGIDRMIEECKAAGRNLGETVSASTEAEEKEWCLYLSKVIELHHATSDEDREEIYRTHDIRLSRGKAAMSSYLPSIQAFYPADRSKKDKGKLTKWSQVGWGMTQGLGIKPTRKEIGRFLSEPDAWKRSMAAFGEIPEVKAERERKAREKKEREAARRNDIQEPQAHRSPESILKEMASWTEDDLSSVPEAVLIYGLCPLIDRAINLKLLNVVAVNDDTLVECCLPFDNYVGEGRKKIPYIGLYIGEEYELVEADDET